MLHSLSALLTLALLAAGAPPAPARVHADAEAFVPKGYRIEARASGDLDGDGRADLSLELVEAGPAADAEGAPTERARRWLVLLAVPGSGWRQVADAGRVLFCATCGGVKSSTSDRAVTQIRKGVVLVEQLRGSRETVQSLLRFRYVPAVGRMQLIGVDLTVRDTLEGTSVRHSTNLLTGAKLTERLRWDEKQERDVKVSSTATKVPARKVYAEEVDLDALEAAP
jgi:hypothetical protein